MGYNKTDQDRNDAHLLIEHLKAQALKDIKVVPVPILSYWQKYYEDREEYELCALFRDEAELRMREIIG